MLHWILLLHVLNLVMFLHSLVMFNCLRFNNTCVDKCPDWMIMKKTNCKQAYWIAQRTCDHPEPALENVLCGFSRCDCPEPMVLHSRSAHCFDIDNCPTAETTEYDKFLTLE